MSHKPLIARTLMAVLLASCGAPVAAQSPQPVTPAVAAFNDAIADYTSMHRRLEQLVGPITLNSTVESINRSMQALAAAIRVKRSNAQQGDLFTPALGHALRARVNEALLESGFTALDVFANERADAVDPFTVRLHVNDTFPWVLASMVFPCVIEALPPLPSELQYRIIGNDLVLVDIHASLVVDILPNVLADLTMWDSPLEGDVGAYR